MKLATTIRVTEDEISLAYEDFFNGSVGMALSPLNFVSVSKLMPNIKKVIFSKPATIVFWSDNTKTVVKCADGEEYSEEVGLAMCIAEKYCGNYSQFKKAVKKGKTYDKD